MLQEKNAFVSLFSWLYANFIVTNSGNAGDNLRAVSKIDPQQEILLLHADTIFESKHTKSHAVPYEAKYTT